MAGGSCPCFFIKESLPIYLSITIVFCLIRLTVFLASGWTIAQILDNYPGVEEADIYACLAYGAEMSRERYVEIGGPSVASQA